MRFESGCGCHFCQGREPRHDDELCDEARELLSGFLIWLGREPLPERIS